MAAMNGVTESYYQQVFGTSSTGYTVSEITGSANEEHGLKNEDSHCESPHSSGLDTAGKSKNHEKYSFSNTEHEEKAKCRTNEIPDCKLRLNSPSERESRSHSRGRSHRSPSGSSSSGSRSRTYYSRSRSSSRSGSHSKRYRRRYRPSSKSSSRSRSRSLGSRYKKHRSRSHRRHQKSPRRYRSRSRSRSHVRVNYGRYRSRSRSNSRSLGRRYNRFVRKPYPPTFRSWRSRSRTRSRSRSPLRLTEKDRRELLEIAKANAAKALGKSVELPPSLKKDSWMSDTLHRRFEGDSGKLTKQSRNLNSTVPTEASTKQAANLFSTDSAVIHPVLNKQDSNLASSQKKEEPKKAQGKWVPIQCQRSLNRRR